MENLVAPWSHKDVLAAAAKAQPAHRSLPLDART
jgi:hypothetical protein